MSLEERREETREYRAFVSIAASKVMNDCLESSSSSSIPSPSHSTSPPQSSTIRRSHDVHRRGSLQSPRPSNDLPSSPSKARGSAKIQEKDFWGHKFWNAIVDECLNEIAHRKLLENRAPSPSAAGTQRSSGAPITANNSTTKVSDSLDDRIARYMSGRPKLSFPPFKNLSDPEQRLVEDVLSDQQGILSNRPRMFGQRASTVYDRRYIAALRAQLHAAETLAQERLEHIRHLEATIETLKSQSSGENLKASTQRQYPGPKCDCQVDREERRRIAEELRDLSHELGLLPERLDEHLRNERSFSAARGRPSKPRFMEDAIVLARNLAYDLTTLDLVQAGLCTIDIGSLKGSHEYGSA